MKQFLPLILAALCACTHSTASRPDAENALAEDYQQSVDLINQLLVDAAIDKDFALARSAYLDNAILLAEYNPLIDGKEDIEQFYNEIYKRQDVVSYKKSSKELMDLGEMLLEIGIFSKTMSDGSKLDGKYFNVWAKRAGELKLKSEAFGYFTAVENPGEYRVLEIDNSPSGRNTRNGELMPLELDAYNALNENCVRDRDTHKLLECYARDAVFYPFADHGKAGIDTLTAHFTEYHRNPVTIDSIEVWTYDYDKVNDGYIQYSMFYVQWTVPGFTGFTEGTGINYYKRQADNSLKFFRQMGLHIHDPGN